MCTSTSDKPHAVIDHLHRGGIVSSVPKRHRSRPAALSPLLPLPFCVVSFLTTYPRKLEHNNGYRKQVHGMVRPRRGLYRGKVQVSAQLPTLTRRRLPIADYRDVTQVAGVRTEAFRGR